MNKITFTTLNGLSLEGIILSQIGHAADDTWYIVACQERICYVSLDGKQISGSIDLLSLTFPTIEEEQVERINAILNS
jgi:hypothetical protein